MSFEDTTEMYRTMRELATEERRDRKAKRLEEIGQLEQQGYLARALAGDVHWRICLHGARHRLIRYLDFWPSTGRYSICYGIGGGKPSYGTLRDDRLLSELLREKMSREAQA